MWRCLAMLGVILAATAVRGADAPFVPPGGAPDHIVTMATRSFGQAQDGVEVHTHHSGWTRIDGPRGDLPTHYIGYADSVVVRINRNASGAMTYFDIQRGFEPGLLRDSFKTGETRTVLGEACDVWDVKRTPDKGQQLVWSSCVTRDGLEVANRVESTVTTVLPRKSTVISVSEATRIDRRPVTLDEVRPPVEALDLKTWNEAIAFSDDRPAASPADYEAVIEPEPETMIAEARVTRTVRRHFPWISIDERRVDGVRTFNLRNEINGFSLTVRSDTKNGFRNLVMYKFRPPGPPGPDADNSHRPIDLQRSETVLGETCKWLDVAPNISDSGLHECRSADGAVLKELQITRGSAHSYVATRLTRRLVPLVEVLPPGDMLAAQSWGLPE